MWGNAEGSIEYTAEDHYADEQYRAASARRVTENLIIMARFALLDADGPPVTHICGVPIEDVKKRAEVFATGINMDSDFAYRFPWS